MIALLVALDVYPERLDRFLAAIEENARQSVAREAGCISFDVAQGIEDPLHFIFYEVYEDQAAIDEHRATPHFAEWRRAADICVVTGSQINMIYKRLFHQP